MKIIISLSFIVFVSLFTLSSIYHFVQNVPEKRELAQLNGIFNNISHCSNTIRGSSRQSFTILDNKKEYEFYILCKHGKDIIPIENTNHNATALYDHDYGLFFIPESRLYHLESDNVIFRDYKNYINNNIKKHLSLIYVLAGIISLIILIKKHLTINSSGTEPAAK